ncbi:hypothetical protein R5R35_007507 [Gryllus longicercus]
MKFIERKDKKDGFEWICRERTVNIHCVKMSVRKDSWFEHSHMEIWKVLLITYMWVMEARVDHICLDVGVNESTVTDWMSFCREVCFVVFENESEPLGGEGVVVEIYESKFGKRKYNRGKRVEGKWVFGGVERGSSRCFFKVVECRSKDILLDIIKNYIKPKSILISDCWKAYDCLKDEGFTHLKVNHSITFKDPESGAHTNSIEGTWSAIKRSFPRHKVNNALIYYLCEYVWRRQFRTEKFNNFCTFIKKIYDVNKEVVGSKK